MGNAIRASKAALICAVLLFGQTVWPQEYTSSVGLLSDQDFYRAVACKAAPGRACVEKTLKWPKFLRSRLSVSLAGVQGSDPHFVGSVRDSLEEAIAIINAANAGVRLRGVWGPQAKLANIQLYVVEPYSSQRTIQRLSYPPLVGLRANPSVSVVSKLGGTILSAGIAVERNPEIDTRLTQIILKELLESLGLHWSIQNPYYDKISIFAQAGIYPIFALGGQDVKALRLHHQ